MKVLFIGGTGTISTACSQLALDRGIDLYLLNRGKTSLRPVPPGAKILTGDIRDPQSARAALEGHDFDAVVDWIAFTADQVQVDLDLFRGRTKQYVFISSASAYQTPPASLPVTESTPLYNPEWQYSRNKIACEELLTKAYREESFPITIVRPSHTYDETSITVDGKWTTIDRMRRGERVVVHGDGTSLWTVTSSRDFAVGLVGLLGNPHAIGESYHITDDDFLTWNQIFQTLADACGGVFRPVYVPSTTIAAFDPEWGPGLLGDKTHSMVFDNTKIKRAVPDFKCVVPFRQGAAEMIQWRDADPVRRDVSPERNALLDRMIAAMDALHGSAR